MRTEEGQRREEVANRSPKHANKAIAIAAAIFAARDLATLKTDRELNSPRAVSAIEDAIIKAHRLVAAIERKLA